MPNRFEVRSDTNHGRSSVPALFRILLGRIARTCGFIPSTAQHWQSRILRKTRIRRGSLAHVKDGPTIRFHPPYKLTVGTQADTIHSLFSLVSTHDLRIQGRPVGGGPADTAYSKAHKENLIAFCEPEEKFIEI